MSVAVFVRERRWPVVVQVPVPAAAAAVLAELEALLDLPAEPVLLPAVLGGACPWADLPNGPVTGPIRPGAVLPGTTGTTAGAGDDQDVTVWWLLDQSDVRQWQQWECSRHLQQIR